MKRPIFCVEFLDDGPDGLGRRRFALTWRDEHAPLYSTEPGKRGRLVGYGPGIRGQHFFADPRKYTGGAA